MNKGDPENPHNITTFNFIDQMRSSKAWVSLYMFNTTADPKVLADLLNLLNVDVKTVNSLLYGPSTGISNFMAANIFTPIFEHY
jgi:hypothetical protein